MIGDYVSKECPECGGDMIVVNETSTFDGTVKTCKCVKCGYAGNCE